MFYHCGATFFPPEFVLTCRLEYNITHPTESGFKFKFLFMECFRIDRPGSSQLLALLWIYVEHQMDEVNDFTMILRNKSHKLCNTLYLFYSILYISYTVWSRFLSLPSHSIQFNVINIMPNHNRSYLKVPFTKSRFRPYSHIENTEFIYLTVFYMNRKSHLEFIYHSIDALRRKRFNTWHFLASKWSDIKLSMSPVQQYWDCYWLLLNGFDLPLLFCPLQHTPTNKDT